MKPIIVMCPVYNASEYLYVSLHKVNNILENLGVSETSRIVLFESNSTDNTKQELVRLHDQPGNISLVVSDTDGKNYTQRTEKMADIRNEMIDYLKIWSLNSTFGHVLFLDFDDILYDGEFTKDGIESCFNTSDWDVMCANQPDGYYDLWALRHQELMPYDCWQEFWKRGSTREALRETVIDRMFSIREDCKPIKVQSAFGGAMFAKMEYIRSLPDKPFLGTVNNMPTCEWVSFCSHTDKCYINPSFVNYRGEHQHIKDIRNMYYGN